MLLAFGVLLLLALLGAFYQIKSPILIGPESKGSDIAWMLTATALVLLMTPGLSFFLRWNGW